MKLNDILVTYHTDPEKSRKYAKEICSNLHGTVQKSLESRLTLLLISAFVILQTIINCTVHSGVFSMLLMIAVTMGLVVWNMYFLSWELTFDGATGFFSFHTMFKGTIRFHASEIGRIHTVTLHNRGQRTECLCIPIHNTKIMVALRKYYFRPSQTNNNYQGCDTNAEKLEQYLTLYQQFLAKDADFSPAQNEDLSPAVRMAIAQQKRQQQQTNVPQKLDTPQEIAPIPEISPIPETPVKPEISAPEKILLSPKTEHLIPEPPKAPNSPFPDPTITAFPDPAMKRDSGTDALFNSVLGQSDKPPVPSPPKPQKKTNPTTMSDSPPNQPEQIAVPPSPKPQKETDVDALFNSVLGQYGKAPVSTSSHKSKKDVDADALFDNVLRQFGKK